MLKIPKERNDRSKPKGRCETFSKMVGTEIRIDGWLERGGNPPSNKATLTNALLKVSTVDCLFIIVGSGVGLWDIVN